jgi:sugar phosphate isomerase/epimerase
MSRLIAHFGALCDLAAGFGLGVDFEFMKFRLVGTLPQALEVVSRAARPNGKLLIDLLHLYRSGGTPEMLKRVPSAMIGSVQLCDAPRSPPEDLVREAREGRLFPGEGDLPLRAFLEAVGADVPMSVEVPTASSWPDLSPFERAARGRVASHRLLSELAHPRPVRLPTSDMGG